MSLFQEALEAMANGTYYGSNGQTEKPQEKPKMSAWFTRGNGPEPVRVLVVQSPNRAETMRDVQKAELAQNPPYVGGTK